MLPFADNSLDLVVAFDVLEHIEDDHQVVREIHRVVRPGGTFLAAVPADPELWSAHDDAVLHLRRYTCERLSEAVPGSLFDVNNVWNWNVLMRPALKMRRQHLTGSDLDSVPPVLNSMLTAIIRLERFLPVSGMPGISIFLQAEARPKLHLALQAATASMAQSSHQVAKAESTAV
jgi:SAM-dependent methyltransferase